MSRDGIGMEIICECVVEDQMRMEIERPRSNIRDQMSRDQMRTTQIKIPTYGVC